MAHVQGGAGAGEWKKEEEGRPDAASAEPSVGSAWPQASLSGTPVSLGKSVKQCFHVYQCSSQMHQCVPFTASWLHVGLGLT